jgi:hypothetical protein
VHNLRSSSKERAVSETYYFTFGSNHTHPATGESLGMSYVEIEGTWKSTRTAMFEVFGRRWSMQYSDPDEAGVERYGLTRIDLPPADGPVHPVPAFGF